VTNEHRPVFTEAYRAPNAMADLTARQLELFARFKAARGAMSKDEFRARRRQLGLTADRLAKLLGLSRNAVENYGCGYRKVPEHVGMLLRILCDEERSS
jgi:DNA-binding transcriptional regulator YiaG